MRQTAARTAFLPKGVLVSSFDRLGVDSKGAARQIKVLKRQERFLFQIRGMPLSGPEKGMTGSAQGEGEPWPISLRERRVCAEWFDRALLTAS